MLKINQYFQSFFKILQQFVILKNVRKFSWFVGVGDPNPDPSLGQEAQVYPAKRNPGCSADTFVFAMVIVMRDAY